MFRDFNMTSAFSTPSVTLWLQLRPALEKLTGPREASQHVRASLAALGDLGPSDGCKKSFFLFLFQKHFQSSDSIKFPN